MMVYNAELLASFEKEKKSYERLVSELRKEKPFNIRLTSG